MANNLDAGIKQTWDKVYQVTHFNIPVYPAFANNRLASMLKVGDTVDRVYTSDIIAKDMGSEGSYSRQDVTDTGEQLTIDKEKEASFYIKELDELQNHLPARMEYANKASAALFNQIDGDVLGDYDQYSLTLDDGDLGGTDGNGIDVTTSNVRELFSKAQKLMQRNNIKLNKLAKFQGFKHPSIGQDRAVAVISPDVYETLLLYLDGKDSALGDQVGVAGHAGRFMGFDLFVSNAVGWSARLEFGTNPTDGDTVTFTYGGKTATFTFKASPSTAGHIDIKGSAALTLDELVASIDAPTTTRSGDFVAFDAGSDEEYVLRNIDATDGATYMTVKGTGYGFVQVGETLTASADIWTTEKQVQHCLLGMSGGIDLVIQKTPNVNAYHRDGYVGHDIVTWAAYGKKVFQEQKYMMVDVQVRTDSY